MDDHTHGMALRFRNLLNNPMTQDDVTIAELRLPACSIRCTRHPGAIVCVIVAWDANTQKWIAFKECMACAVTRSDVFGELLDES